MGADFIMASCRVAPGNVTRAELIERVMRIEDGRIVDLIAHYGFDDGEHDDGLTGHAVEARIERLTREALADSVRAIFNEDGTIDFAGNRDLGAMVCHHGDLYVVTGGMSWGDAPTDSWDNVRAIATSEITLDDISEGVL